MEWYTSHAHGNQRQGQGLCAKAWRREGKKLGPLRSKIESRVLLNELMGRAVAFAL